MSTGQVYNTGHLPNKSTVHFLVQKCDPGNSLHSIRAQQIDQLSWWTRFYKKEKRKVPRSRQVKVFSRERQTKCDSLKPIRLFSEITLISFDKFVIHHQHPRTLHHHHHHQHHGCEPEPICLATVVITKTILVSMILMIR